VLPWAYGHRGKVALGARGCAGTGQVVAGARVGGGPGARHLQGSRVPMSSRLGLAFDFSRWCRAGTVSVWSSGVWVLLARWPRSRGRRRVAACVPRVTRHGNPQRCCIRRWWGKLRGAGLERVVCSGGLRARSEQSTTQRQQDHQQVSGPGAFRHRAPRGPPPYLGFARTAK